MKKSKLIELLNGIDGDPDVKLWNGHVQDWMDIDGLQESKLFKMRLDAYLDNNQWSRRIQENNVKYQLTDNELISLNKMYREVSRWDDVNSYPDGHITSVKHMKKRIVYINAKTRNKTGFDRSGSIEY